VSLRHRKLTIADKIRDIHIDSRRRGRITTRLNWHRVQKGKGDNIILPNVRILDENQNLKEAKAVAYSIYNRYSDSEAVSAVEEADPLELKAQTVKVNAGTDETNQIGMILFGKGDTVYPLVNVDFVTGAGSPNYLDQCHDVAIHNDHILAVARGNDDALTIWGSKANLISDQLGVVRGAGSPNYLNENIVIFLKDNFIYSAATGDDALTIIDVTDPTSPVHATSIVGAGGVNGNYLDGVYSVFVLENYAYVVARFDAALSIYDVSDPYNPVKKSHVSGKGGAGGHYLDGANDVWVYQSGQYIYAAVVARADGSLSIYDVTDPENIQLKDVIHHKELGGVDAYELAGAIKVQIEGDYAYVATRFQDAQSGSEYFNSGERVGSVTIFDVSDVTDITHVGEIHGRGSGPTQGGYPNGKYLGEAHWLHKVGNYCYVAAFCDDALTVIDVSTPSNPTQAGYLTGAGSPTFLDGPVSVCVNGNYAYVACYYDDGFLIYDISDPSSITRVGGRVGQGDPYWLHKSHSVIYNNGKVYVGSRGYDDAITIWSVEDGLWLDSSPKGVIKNGDGGASMDEPMAVVAKSDYAYVCALGSDTLLKIDISDLTNPTLDSQVTHNGSTHLLDGCANAFIAGNYIYVVATNSASLSIYSLTGSLTNPVGKISGAGESGNYLGGARGIYVLEDFPETGKDTAYVAAQNDDALVVIDVTNKASPQRINQVSGTGIKELLDGAINVVVDKNTGYAYVIARYSDALTVWDVSNVDANNPPIRVGNISGAGAPNYLDQPYGMCKDGDYVYVASLSDNALMQFDVSDSIPKVNKQLRGSGAPNYLGGPVAICVGEIHNTKYVVVASFNDDAISVNKISDVGTMNKVGFRNINGTLQFRNAFGEWINLS